MGGGALTGAPPARLLVGCPVAAATAVLLPKKTGGRRETAEGRGPANAAVSVGDVLRWNVLRSKV